MEVSCTTSHLTTNRLHKWCRAWLWSRLFINWHVHDTSFVIHINIVRLCKHINYVSRQRIVWEVELIVRNVRSGSEPLISLISCPSMNYALERNWSNALGASYLGASHPDVLLFVIQRLRKHQLLTGTQTYIYIYIYIISMHKHICMYVYMFV